MMWFKKLLYRWAMAGGNALAHDKSSPSIAEIVNSPGNRPDSNPMCQVTLRKAVNGYFLELAQHKPQPRGPDWQYSYFVLTDTADLSSAIAALLVNQRLEQ